MTFKIGDKVKLIKLVKTDFDPSELNDCIGAIYKITDVDQVIEEKIGYQLAGIRKDWYFFDEELQLVDAVDAPVVPSLSDNKLLTQVQVKTTVRKEFYIGEYCEHDTYPMIDKLMGDKASYILRKDIVPNLEKLSNIIKELKEIEEAWRILKSQ